MDRARILPRQLSSPLALQIARDGETGFFSGLPQVVREELAAHVNELVSFSHIQYLEK